MQQPLVVFLCQADCKRFKHVHGVPERHSYGKDMPMQRRRTSTCRQCLPIAYLHMTVSLTVTILVPDDACTYSFKDFCSILLLEVIDGHNTPTRQQEHILCCCLINQVGLTRLRDGYSA